MCSRKPGSRSCADLWLGNGKAVSELAQAQIVVQLGSSLTSKRVLQWQATCEPEEYWLVDNLPGRLDPAQHRGRRLVCAIDRWLEQHPAENDSRGPPSFPSFRARHGRRRSPAARISAKPSWRSESGAICRNRASCLSATARWCA